MHRKIIYIVTGLIFYLTAVIYLHSLFNEPFAELLIPLFVVGIGLSLVSWLFVNQYPDALYKPYFRREIVFIILLVIWIGFYITYGGSLINKFMPANWIENPAAYAIIIFVRKLLFFVMAPFLLYKIYDFSLKDFGLKDSPVKLFSWKLVILILISSIVILLFQYYAGRGGRELQHGSFSTLQFTIGIPLCFVYLLFDAGLIEEFFFRGFLQSRLSVLLKSTTGGIVVSAILFGLVHAPGLYLRGTASEGIEEQMPFLFFTAYSIAYMSVAGIFLGIVYSKTKNLWLVMVIHALVDLLPNLGEFIHTWNIK